MENKVKKPRISEEIDGKIDPDEIQKMDADFTL